MYISPSAATIVAAAQAMYLQSIKPIKWTAKKTISRKKKLWSFFSVYFFLFFVMSKRATTRHILKSIVVRITVDRYNERLLSFLKITRLFLTRSVNTIFFSLSRCMLHFICVPFCFFFVLLLSRFFFFLYLDIARFGVVCKNFQPEIHTGSCDICAGTTHAENNKEPNHM